MDIHEIEKKAKEKAQKDFDTSPEMQKLLEEQKKLKQKEERLKDRMIKLRKQETEKKRKARNHRLIVLGAVVEDALGIELPESSEEMEALVRYYLPKIRDEIDSGKLYDRLDALKEKEEPKQEA